MRMGGWPAGWVGRGLTADENLRGEGKCAMKMAPSTPMEAATASSVGCLLACLHFCSFVLSSFKAFHP